jgi:ribosomal-protein-alanine N-acetyltransferase
MRIPPLETERLVIRELTEPDAPAVLRLAGLGGRWLSWTALAYEQLAELRQPPYGDRAVVMRSTGRIVGLVGLVPSLGPFGLLPSWPADGARYTPEVGLFYLVAEHYRCQGIASEAAAALARHALDDLHLARIVATTERTNHASIGVMRRLGMQIEENPAHDPPWFQVVGVLAAAELATSLRSQATR